MAARPQHDAPFSAWDGRSILLRSPLGACFRIHPGGRIEDLDPADGNPDKQALFEGQALGHSLHIRRILALHGSASVGPHGAVGVLGFSGWGKSTLGAHLIAAGYGFLTDDVLAVESEGLGFQVLAGPAVGRLWPDAAAALGFQVESLDKVWAGHEKRRVPRETVAPAAPLAALYVIDRDASEVDVEQLSPSQAFTELVRHSFAFMLLRERPEEWHFRACSALAKAIPIFRLGVPHGLSNVGRASRLIVEKQA